MHRKQWIFDMDGTLTDSMTVVWQGAHRWSCCAAMAAPQDPASTMFC